MTLRINTTYNAVIKVRNVKEVYLLGNLLVIKQTNNRRTFYDYSRVRSVIRIGKRKEVKKVGSFTIAVIILALVLLVIGVIGCLNKAHTDNTKWLQNSWNEVMNEQRHLLEMIRENQNQIARLLRKLESEDERKD